MINLTIPLYPYIPVGNVFPWDSPFTTEDIATYELNAARLFYISLGSDTGTRLMGPSLVSREGPFVTNISLDSLVNRETTVIKIPKEAGSKITYEELRDAFQTVALRKHDAILIATEWGNNKNWKSLGEEYALQTPFFSMEAASFLLEKMEEIDSNLLLTDCLYLDEIRKNKYLQEWLSYPAWTRVPWPYEMAKAFLRNHSGGKLFHSFKVTRKILEKVWVIAGLANCGELKSQRSSINCIPMFIEDVGEVPCTVIADDFEE